MTAERSRIDELEAILNSEDNSPVTILPDGTIEGAPDPREPTQIIENALRNVSSESANSVTYWLLRVADEIAKVRGTMK